MHDIDLWWLKIVVFLLGGENMGYFLTGLICLIVGAVAGIGVYWYFVVHRKLIDVPEDIKVKK